MTRQAASVFSRDLVLESENNDLFHQLACEN